MAKIIQCIIVDDEVIAREILETYIQKIESINLVASCKNAMEAFNAINTNQVDLVLLDINMPEISGLSFAKSITKDIKVIFTTAYREYAIDGFDLQAVDYLLKPISFERFFQAINKYLEDNKALTVAVNEESDIQRNNYIFVRVDRKMHKINFEDILYIESLSDYIKIFTKKKMHITRETISSLEEKLPNNLFLRIHRSYIISIEKIESYTNEYIEINKKALPISRSYKKKVLDYLN